MQRSEPDRYAKQNGYEEFDFEADLFFEADEESVEGVEEIFEKRERRLVPHTMNFLASSLLGSGEAVMV